ncbi:DMT family transporter [Lactiplantibacillus plajomi]|uniref:DMT family transporter n=1 Tax=Lactiplantibacillus plajomi TaxID=1457217 RepID=A0ABV6K7N6_9LACO|nr:DMT family transporter [Lactiplantibacillus plajomi]
MVWLPVLIGAGLAVQTGVNARLRQLVGSPFLASAVSFAIGALALNGLLLVTSTPITIPLRVFARQPAWLWLGGVLGVVGLTVNLVLFTRLGSVRAAVLPIFGQILAGIIIDQFGWWGAPRQPLTAIKLLGLLAVTGGVRLAIGWQPRPFRFKLPGQWRWSALGIFAGGLVAVQATINGRLGTVLRSASHAAAISFTAGALLLLLLVVALRVPVHLGQAWQQAGTANWWLWSGGLLGAAYVLGLCLVSA